MKCVFHCVVFWKERKIQWKIFYLIDEGGYVLQGFRWQEIKLVFHFMKRFLFWPPSRLAKTFILQSKKELVKMFTYKLSLEAENGLSKLFSVHELWRWKIQRVILFSTTTDYCCKQDLLCENNDAIQWQLNT